MPSTVAYVSTSVAIAIAVFCLLWWMMASVGDEAPWLPAGMAAGFVVLIAVSAREVMVRRAWARHTLEMERHSSSGSSSSSGESASQSQSKHRAEIRPSVRSSAHALRALQQHLAEAEARGAQQPQAHLEAYRLCEQYLSNTESAIRSSKTTPDARAALHAGHERVRELKKHHLLAWARGETKRVMDEARRRVRVSDKIETAQRAVDVIEEALRVYPEDEELRASAQAVRDFVASVKISHWVELAERAAFRGLYSRAIARYRDALFYVSRADMAEDARADAAGRIYREIELLRARLATSERPVKKGSATFVAEAEKPARERPVRPLESE
ncbi:MAG TPA: hypothetical protein VGB73_02795 [Pyrinomonadaceae bacterium]|jgi:tetratricopeptide (TPR) repeat protein